MNEWFEIYNRTHNSDYQITERIFPQSFPYGWQNFPFDYWNIWVRNAGVIPFKRPCNSLKDRVKLFTRFVFRRNPGEPTLELLANRFDLIVFKHCFPVSDILADTGNPDISSEDKRIEQYKLQYLALREKMRVFPDTRFLLWTGPALTAEATTYEAAVRAQMFFEWVKYDWDQPGDNIFLFDFRTIETAGGLFLKDEYASGPKDSHPNEAFSQQTVPLLCQRIIDVAEGRGDGTTLTGEG
jgi:hypothetical protein